MVVNPPESAQFIVMNALHADAQSVYAESAHLTEF
jgi:hypothetical protein